MLKDFFRATLLRLNPRQRFTVAGDDLGLDATIGTFAGMLIGAELLGVLGAHLGVWYAAIGILLGSISGWILGLSAGVIIGSLIYSWFVPVEVRGRNK